MGRRAFLHASGLSLVSSGIVGGANAASAEDVVTLSGSVESHDGSPVPGWQVFISSRGDFHDYFELNDSGTFSAIVSPNTKYHLGFYKSPEGGYPAPVRSSVPHIEGLGEVTMGSRDVDIGTKTLSKAYPVDIRALDDGGEPAISAQIHFYSDGYGPGYRNTFVNEDGYYTIQEADFTGVDLAGSVTVDVTFGEEQYDGQTFVTSPMTAVAQRGQGITFEQNFRTETSRTTESTTTTSERTTTKTKTPTTTQQATANPPPSTDVHSATTDSTQSVERDAAEIRGFFTNDGSSERLDLLSNPLHLTVGGFILSVFGVVLELMRGK